VTQQSAGRVLVVDDNEQNLALIRAQLELAGYVVSTATSGGAGLAAAAADRPDLIVLDVMMPELDGYEVCQRLRADAATASTPIVMLTALHERADKLRALETGADDFLSKPVDRAELLARVRSLVRQKRLLATVEQERATLDAVMASMTDGLLVVDADDRIRFCNARAATFLHLDPAEAVGTRAERAFERLLLQMPGATAAGAAWRSALADPGARPSFELSLTADGQQRDVLVDLFPFQETGRPAPENGTSGQGVGVLLRDVTPQRDLARAKDELVAVVSHELRTPLASLVGFAELLLVREFDEEERREFLGIIQEEGRRLTSLVNDFLDLQRMESGRQTVVPVPIELGPVLARAVAAAGDDPARPIVLDRPPVLPLVSADADRVLQVLANLLSNARKFSPRGGQVTLAARPLEGEVEVSVRDRGLGLPPEAVPCLFEKFYRVDNSDRREIKGTGLGLAICRQIVEAHGGEIGVESEGLGTGARFTFTLPTASPVVGSGDVLVVDDDSGFARLLEEAH
jgi:signal transduction histidine kinase